MIKVREITTLIEKIAPPSLQEDYDNAGLIIGNEEMEAEACLISIDVTEPVIEQAIRNNCRLIISHHPVIFNKIKRLTGNTLTERIIAKAIKADIAIYALHTNLDNIAGGVNKVLCSKLGLSGCSILRKKKGLLKKLVTFCPESNAENIRMALFQAGAGHIGQYDRCSFNMEGLGSFRAGEGTNPYVGQRGETHFEKEIRIETVFPAYIQYSVVQALLSSHPYEEVAYDIYPLENEFDQVGAGMIGHLDPGMEETEFLQMIKDVLHVPCIRHSGLIGKKVRKVAVCGGSGSFLIQDAIMQKADFFVTSDIRYHQFQEADGKIVIVDAGHYETEQFTCDLIASYLKENFSNFAVLISEIPTNPVNYF